MKERKEAVLKVRVAPSIKAKVLALAEQRGEGESVIVREALVEYFQRRGQTINSPADEEVERLQKLNKMGQGAAPGKPPKPGKMTPGRRAKGI